MLIYILGALLLMSIVFGIIKKAVKLVFVLVFIAIVFLLFRSLQGKDMFESTKASDSTFYPVGLCIQVLENVK